MLGWLRDKELVQGIKATSAMVLLSAGVSVLAGPPKTSTETLATVVGILAAVNAFLIPRALSETDRLMDSVTVLLARVGGGDYPFRPHLENIARVSRMNLSGALFGLCAILLCLLWFWGLTLGLVAGGFGIYSILMVETLFILSFVRRYAVEREVAMPFLTNLGEATSWEELQSGLTVSWERMRQRLRLP